ncbi:MAG: metallophosphoesterase [Shewanella sp.]|nr:metallophosphoesterase [Shewanella sp.]MCG7935430.1 metallophosphoesterase [Candidatus Thiodiazotropha taylori]
MQDSAEEGKLSSGGYRLLIIDDQFSVRQHKYSEVLESEYSIDFIKNDSEIENELSTKQFDGVILDLILRPDFSLSSATILGEYLSQYRIPVFLLTGKWKEDETAFDLLRVMAIGNTQVRGLLDWVDFDSDMPYGRENVLEFLKLEMDKWYRREPRTRVSGDAVKLLHLSDSQIGDPDYNFLSTGVEDGISKVLGNGCEKPDLIVLSGDVVYSGEPSQYRKASGWCKRLATSCLGSVGSADYKERIVVVPGNHDVDFTVLCSDGVKFNFGVEEGKMPIDLDETFLPKAQEEEDGEPNNSTYPHHNLGLSSYRVFLQETVVDAPYADGDAIYIDRFINWGIEIVALSTAGFATIGRSQSVGVSQGGLDHVTRKMRSRRPGNEPYKILVTHHPPPEILNSDPDETARWNGAAWDRFRAWLGRMGFDLWLAGHTHYGEVRKLSERSGMLGMPCVVCPTLTLKQRSRGEDSLRGFAMISLEYDESLVAGCNVEFFEIRGAELPKKNEEKSEYFPRATGGV